MINNKKKKLMQIRKLLSLRNKSIKEFHVGEIVKSDLIDFKMCVYGKDSLGFIIADGFDDNGRCHRMSFYPDELEKV